MAAAVVTSDMHSPASDRVVHSSRVHDSQEKHADNVHEAETSQVHTPPTTDEASHKDDDAASTSSLSDLGDVDIDQELRARLDMEMAVDNDDEVNRQRFEEAARAGAEAERFSEVKPDRYENGVPIFTPSMEQFRDFEKYVKGVNPYGMQSGIVLIDPPEEWKQARKPLDENIKTIKIKNPITQEFHGAQGIYTQRNMEKMRSYNLPQWKAICEQTENQPPAKRGEKRLNADKLLGRGSARNRKTSLTPSEPGKRRPGRPPKIKSEPAIEPDSGLAAPPTPTSPDMTPAVIVKREQTEDGTPDPTPTKGRRGKTPAKPRGRQSKAATKKDAGGKTSETTVAARRLRNVGAAADEIDEEAFKDFDYRYHDNDRFTADRCEELEDKYWKSLNFSNPMYAADMPGSLFDSDTKEWNVAKLPNLLDLLGQPIPGVNTAYLYLGMWRATFAWHLEDVDLYSINYIHFGAPKQWYSISQKDAPKFENAMKSIWSSDAKNCDQFLRHKTYLVSPALLKSKYGVQVNKVVHREGQFVITFPIGYHSGYNLGYNCAESVNFADENWLQYGKTARKCQCEADSVFIDVDWFIRRMHGEPSPEFEEIEVTDDEDGGEMMDLPTPPGSELGKTKPSQKRKRAPKDVGPQKRPRKVIRIRKVSKVQPCCLCPNDFVYEELIPTTHGEKAHRTCAMYTPETYIATQDGKEMVFNVENISKARLDLRCHECKQKKGSCFQCSSAKCTRAYHATCAMQAGVQVDKGEIAVWHEGVEYRDVGFDWRCKLHRMVKRTRVTSELSACNHANNWYRNKEFVEYLSQLKAGELIQWQATNTDDIEAGVVMEGYDHGSNSVLVSVLPGQRVVREIEPAWILFVDSAASCLQKPSANALELPEDLQGKTASMSDSSDRKPSEGDPFTTEPKTEWAEFVSAEPPHNKWQKKTNLAKDKQIWFYLGEKATDSKPQYTADLSRPIHDPASNFLDMVGPPKSAMAPPPQPRKHSLAASYPYPKPNSFARDNALINARQQASHQPYGHATPSSASDGQQTWPSGNLDPAVNTQHASQSTKPSQYHDFAAAVEARANEQARILQRQQAKAQQLDMQQRPHVTMKSIGIDQQAVARQKQFQQQASLHSRYTNDAFQQHPFDKPMPTLQQYPQPLPHFDVNEYPLVDNNRPQQFQYSSDWLNVQNGPHPSVFSPMQGPAMPQMQTASPQLAQSPMIMENVEFTGNLQQHGSHLPHTNSTSMSNGMTGHYINLPHSNSTGSQSNDSRRDMPRPPTVQGPPPRTPTELERQRRISNPAYPFKSPEQIVAQKEEREKHGSQSSGSRPSSRPGSGYTTKALPSPGLHPISFGPEFHHPPMFINPNATQISPPGSSGGHRQKSSSISLVGAMGPPALSMPPFRRSMSSGTMITPDASMTGIERFGSLNQPLPTLSQFRGRPASKSMSGIRPRLQMPDAPIAHASGQLAATLQARPTQADGAPQNDRSIPPAYLDWQAKGGFWGRVAKHFMQQHERAATVYKSPFGHGSDISLMPKSVGSADSLAGRFYSRLSAQDRYKIDQAMNEQRMRP